MIEGIITALVSGLLSAIGFFVVRWLEGINRQLEELEKMVNELADTVTDMKREVVTREELSARCHRINHQLSTEIQEIVSRCQTTSSKEVH